MKVSFTSLELTNFRSIKHASLSFVPGLHLVLGNNLIDEYSDSNGTGKSTFFSGAIPYVVHGKFRSPKGKIIKTGFENRNGDGSCEAILRFMANDTPLEIRRGRRKGKAFLDVTGSGTPIRGDADLSDLIGCDFQTLTSLLILTRASFESSLFYAGDTKRKEFFLSIAGIDQLINAALEIIKREKSDYSLGALELKTVLDVETSRNNFGAVIQNKQIEIDNLDTKVEEIRTELSVIPEKIESITKHILMIDSEVKTLDQKIVQLTELSSQFAILTSLYEKKGALTTRIEEMKNSQVDANTYGGSLKRMTGTECSKCGQPVTQGYVKETTDRIEEYLKSLKQSLEQKTKELSELVEQINGIEGVKAQTQTFIKQYQGRKAVLDKDKKNHQTNLSDLQSEYSSGSRLLEEFNNIRIILTNEIESLERQQARFLIRNASLTSDYNCYYNFEMACNSWSNFLRQTLPSIALQRIAAFLSSFSDRCLKSLWDSRVSLSVRFNEATTDLDINLTDIDKRSIDLESLSSGEQARVYLSLALGSIIATRSFRGWNANIFVLDEVFDGLDKTGREVVLTLLQQMASKFEMCIYVISHHQDFGEYAGSVYTFIKDDTGSVLQVN